MIEKNQIFTLGNIQYKTPILGSLSTLCTNFFLCNDLNLENTLRNLSFVFLLFAMFYFWIQFAFYFSPSFSTNVGSLSPPSFKDFGNLLILLANLSLLFLLLLRWKISGHFPLSNLYESLMFLSWTCTLLHFILVKMFILESTQSINRFNLMYSNKDLQQKILGSLTTPCALFLNAYATFSLPSEMQKVAPLVPALQSNWLMMHVTVMILSYAALILGSLFSIVYLILASFPYGGLFNLSVSSQETTSSSHNYNERSNPSPFALRVLHKYFVGTSYHKESKNFILQSLADLIENLENYSYRLIGIGFSFLTIGILSGAVWANEAWGSYWSWDPKETWAFLTWLIYAIYLHTRITKGWEGQKPAMLASVGFLSVWICFLGVNLIGEGLHSYGWFSKSI